MPPDTLALACYACSMCFTQSLAVMTTHHPKFCIHTVLQLVGLTTAKLLPTALVMAIAIYQQVVNYVYNYSYKYYVAPVASSTIHSDSEG